MANYNKVGKVYDYNGIERSVLKFSAKFIAENNRSPKLKEIIEGLNIKCCFNTINATLNRLEDKGFIHMYGTRPYRFFEITKDGLDSIDMKDLFGMPMEFHDNSDATNSVDVIKDVSPIVDDVVIEETPEVSKEEPIVVKDVSYKAVLKFKKIFADENILAFASDRESAYAMLDYLISNDLINVDAFNKFVK